MTGNSQTLDQKLYMPALLLSLFSFVIVAALPLFGEVGMANPGTASTIGLWINFFGKFHPLFLHLPIGALMLVLMMEAASLITRGKYKPNTTIGLFFAALTGVFAAIFGYFLFLTGGYEGELIEAHKDDGIVFTLVLIAAFALKYTLDVKPNIKLLKPVYFSALGFTGIMMMSAGHHGGEISHGDPIDALPSKVLAKRESKKNAPVDADPMVYKQYIHPILEAKCISCHGADKQKGALRMDTVALMLEGGEETAVLVPGNVKESSLVTFLHLPMADDQHMPPEGKTQMTAEEINVLEWWVASGASETARRSELEITPAIQSALASLLTPEQRVKQRLAQQDELAAKKNAEKMRLASLTPKLNRVNTLYPGSLNFISQGNSDLSFSAVSHRAIFGDKQLVILATVADDLVDLDLSSTSVTDAAVTQLKKFTKLKKVKLNGTKISDKTVQALAKLQDLEIINIYGTEVTDKGAASLKKLKHLRRVYVWNTKVSKAGAEQLQDALQGHQDADSADRAQVILGLDTTAL